MLKIALSQIPADVLALVFEKDARSFTSLKELVEAGEVAFQAPLRFELRVRHERDIIRVDGHMTAFFILACSRCLEPFESRIEQPFTLRYARQKARDSRTERSADIEMKAEQIGLSFYEGEEIDLHDALQEQAILALPIKPLCREACRGLCPQCGTDLNRGTCQCRLKSQNGPFDKLKSLKLN